MASPDRFLRAVAFAFALLPPALAVAQDLIQSREVLEDPAGSLTIADAAKGTFVPEHGVIARGYTPSAHWIRLRVRAPARGTDVVLRISNTYLDEVRLYVPDDGHPSGWATRVTGDRYPYELRDRPAIPLAFLVSVRAPEATFYLRLKTTSTSLLAVSALEPREADRQDRQVDYAVVFFAAFMLWMFFAGLQDYVASREPLSGLFSLYQAVYLVYGLGNLGYFAPLAPAALPQLADLATSVALCTGPFAFSLLSRKLFQSYAPPRSLAFGLDLLLAAFPIQLVAIATGHVQAVLAANVILIIGARWYYLLVALAGRKENVPSRGFVQVVYLVTALLVTVLLFPALGARMFAASHLRDAVGLILNGVITSSLFFAVMLVRSRAARKVADRNAFALLVTKKELEMEHALKEHAEAQARTDYLTGLASRRHFVELAERELARAERYRKPLALMMIDIDFFKEVNDTRGHSVGDTVLQVVASRIRDALREVDLVGRIGGEEFAAILVENEGPQALEVAQRVRKAVGEAEIAPPEGPPVRVTVSVGLTELRARQANIDMLFAEADKALYAAKDAGRNCVRVNEP